MRNCLSYLIYPASTLPRNISSPSYLSLFRQAGRQTACISNTSQETWSKIECFIIQLLSSPELFNQSSFQ